MRKIDTCSRWLVTATAVVSMMVVGADGGGGQEKRFEDVTEVVVVEVPVQVLKNGEPVRGLTADDFEITAARKKQRITGFDVVDLTLTDPSGAPVEVPTGSARRHFLFFFDLSFSDPGSIVRARQAAIELVEKGLHPSDLAAVGSYSRATGGRLVLGFTPDRDQVKLAIETLGLPQLVESKRDPLGLIYNDMQGPNLFSESAAGQQGGGGAGGGRPDVEAEIRELLVMMEGRERRASDTRDILSLTSSMTGMAQMMNGVAGRKHVVFLSEGFDSSLLLGVQGATAEEQRRIQETNEAAMAGRIWEVQSDDRFGDTNMQSQLTDMLEEFIRADCTIQAVDIAGLRADSDVSRPQGRTEDSLFIMANDTGGEFFYNFNNLYDAMGKMLERTSVTYVLAFQMTDVKFDGRYHKLKVQLKNGMKGVDLVHRPGYYAPRPYGEISKIERQLISSSAIMGAPGGAVGTSVLAAAFPTGGDTAYVPVLIEIDGAGLLAGTGGEVLPTEIYTYAISAEGIVEDYFVQTLGLDLNQVRPALQQTGFKYWGHFDLPPDNYNIRVLVRNGYTGSWGVEVLPITVPNLEKGEALVLPPFFPEPQGKWLLGREDQAQQGNYEYPFMMRNNPFIPAARPTVQPGQAAKISLVAYNLGGAIPDAEGVLLSPDGTEAGAVQIALEEQELGSDPSLVRYVATCTIPSVESGPYRLQVKLSDPESGEEQTSSIQLRVIG